MTHSIELPKVRANVTDASNTTPAPTNRRTFLVIRILTGVCIVGWAGHLGAALVTDSHDLLLLGSANTFIILAAIGGALLVIRRMLSTRQDYYRAGQLDGWMRGWNGQPPENHTPGVQ